jgi:ABC-type bacteriocin/lantibiotic exporter with double-glycine peptidase domain
LAGPTLTEASGTTPQPSEPSLVQTLRALLIELSPERRRTMLPLLLMMLAGAFAELCNLGALIAFLSIIADPARIERIGTLASVLSWLGGGDQRNLVYVSAALFAITIILAGGIRLLLVRATLKFVFGVAYEMGVRLYRDTLHQEYVAHTQRNSSEIIAAINKAHLVTEGVLMPLMQAAIAVVLATFIIGGLIWIDPLVAVACGAVLASIYIVTSLLSRARLHRASRLQAKAQGTRIQAMQEGLGGIRDVLLDRSQPVFLEVYERAERNMRDARYSTQFAAQSPRFIVEGLGMIVVAVVACILSTRPAGLVAAIPTLGALALGAQRLLPMLQIIYIAWALTTASRQVLVDVVTMLKRPIPPPGPTGKSLAFRDVLELDQVGYRYAGADCTVLGGISLTIPRGARIGIAGRTGSGKSTLMDIVIGLLEPTDGEIRVDGVALTADNRRAWQRNIAHVPQAIFLSDASIAENIAFGVRAAEIDLERARRAAEQAELGEVIAALPNGYATLVGERGIQLSGGQRQRIGIARALYKRASVLVLDEATSALDNETEAAVMRSVNRLDRSLTVLIIAHRLSTLRGCDQIILLEGGRVVHRYDDEHLSLLAHR